jgi:hypothetical protein
MRIRFGLSAALTLVLTALSGGSARAQQTTGSVAGGARDQTGGVLPGVSVELSIGTAITRSTETDGNGRYRFDDVPQGTYVVTFHLLNFGELERRDVVVSAGQVTAVDGVLALSLNADVVVTGKRSFVNLADADNPAENLIGVAQSASQGAITARQLEVRPVLRAGDQYFLRGFNLDHHVAAPFGCVLMCRSQSVPRFHGSAFWVPSL